MTTCRTVATEALSALKALAPGDEMNVDESAAALEAISNLLLELHEARGPLTDVDVTADYTAGENERVRVQEGYTVTVSLPNSVASSGSSPSDYGFTRSPTPATGYADPADGYVRRQPRDGSRIEIVGTTQDLYFYRSDINTWASVYDLTLDSTLPLSARYVGPFGALVAQRMIDRWPGLFEPTPSLARRIARANSAMMVRPGTARDPVVGEYF